MIEVKGTQIEAWLKQFCGLFSRFVVEMGDCECSSKFNVPVVYGNPDRVALAVGYGNAGGNKPMPIPCIAVNLANVRLSDNQSGMGTSFSIQTMPVGGVFPDSLRSTEFRVPIRVVLELDVYVVASNYRQYLGLVESILKLGRTVALQINDKVLSPANQANAELVGSSSMDNYPPGQSQRLLAHGFTYQVDVGLMYEVKEYDDVIKQVNLTVGSMDNLVVYAVTEDGALVTFDGGSSSTSVR
jgi:hypothetical protein